MKKRVIAPPGVPTIGPYSPAVAAGPFLFVSGQIPLRAATGELVGDDIRAATAQAMENISTILAAADFSWADVVKTTLYLADMSDFPAVNEVYGGYFQGEHPARVTVQVAALPRGARIEIDAVAFKAPLSHGDDSAGGGPSACLRRPASFAAYPSCLKAAALMAAKISMPSLISRS